MEKRKADMEERKAEKRKADSEKLSSKPILPEKKRRKSQPLQDLVPMDTSPCGTLSAQAAAQKAAIEDKFLADLDGEDDSSTCPF